MPFKYYIPVVAPDSMYNIVLADAALQQLVQCAEGFAQVLHWNGHLQDSVMYNNNVIYTEA